MEQVPNQNLEGLPCPYLGSPPLAVPQFLLLQNVGIGSEISGAVHSDESPSTRDLEASSQLQGTEGAFDGGGGGNGE